MEKFPDSQFCLHFAHNVVRQQRMSLAGPVFLGGQEMPCEVYTEWHRFGVQCTYLAGAMVEHVLAMSFEILQSRHLSIGRNKIPGHLLGVHKRHHLQASNPRHKKRLSKVEESALVEEKKEGAAEADGIDREMLFLHLLGVQFAWPHRVPSFRLVKKEWKK